MAQARTFVKFTLYILLFPCKVIEIYYITFNKQDMHSDKEKHLLLKTQKTPTL